MNQQLATIQDARPLAVSDVVFNDDNFNHLVKLADLMASSTVTVPKHLQGKPGDCFAIALQAMAWNMSPFVVAQKTHLVNGVLGYEAQLVNALVQNSGLIQGSFKYEYQDDNEGGVFCRVGAALKGDDHITWGEWLHSGSVTTKNSPLWKSNPRQQLGYLQVKNWARLYAPGAILGIYGDDELADQPPRPVRDITPDATVSRPPPARRPEPAANPEPKPEALRELVDYPDAKFAEQAPKWFDLVDSGKQTPESINAKLADKGQRLSDLQLLVLRRIEGGPTLEQFVESLEAGELS